MAAGDITFFEEFVRTLGEEKHNFSSDTIKVGLVTNGVTPAAGDTTPTWSDYSGSEVSTAGGYTSGGETLTTVTWTEAGGVATLDADSIALAQNGSGFTNAYWAIIYNDTSADDDAIAFVDLGGPVSEQAGAVNINWDPGGIIGTEQGHGTTWFVYVNNTSSELPTLTFSSGKPSSNADAASVTGGTGSHEANHSGAYEFNGDSAAAAYDWSSTSYGDTYVGDSNQTHRISCVKNDSNNGYGNLTITPSTAISYPTSGEKIRTEFLASATSTDAGPQMFCRLLNSSGEFVEVVFDGDASGFPQCYIRCNVGGLQSGSKVGDSSIGTSTVNQYRVEWDPDNESNMNVYFNGTRVDDNTATGPQFPANWPGWSTFGDVVCCTFYTESVATGGAGTNYAYAAWVGKNTDFP